MNRQEFLENIRKRLSGLPQYDVDKLIDYYNEMIDDRMEDGLSEKEAIEALGSVDDIVSQILMNTPLTTIVKEKVRPKHNLRVLEIILLVLGFPLWGSLLLAAIMIILAMYIVLLSLILVMYSVDFAFASCVVAGIAGCVIMICTGKGIASVLFLLGGGLISAGIAIILFFVFNKAAKSVLMAGKNILLGIKCCIIGKEDK